MEKTKTIEELTAELYVAVADMNGAHDVSAVELSSLTDKMNSAKQAVNDYYINERLAELSAMDVVAMWKSYVDMPYTPSGVAVKQDTKTKRWSVSSDPVTLFIPLESLIQHNDRQIVSSMRWKLSIDCLRFALVACSCNETKVAQEKGVKVDKDKPARNPLSVTDAMYAYAKARDWKLHDANITSLKKMCDDVLADILPADMLDKLHIYSADVRYLLHAVCTTASANHNAKFRIKKATGVQEELFTVYKTRLHNGEYTYADRADR